MAAFEVLALDPTTPQIRAPGASDTYSFPRAITPSGANVTPFTLSGYSLTGANAQSMFDLSGTWNTSGTPTALKLNITDTASNSGSLLVDLQVGGSTRFNVTKAGSTSSYGTTVLSSGAGVIQMSSLASYGYHMAAGYAVTWGNSATLNGSIDISLVRDAANTLAQRNGTAAQAFRVYNTYTDASNGEWLEKTWATNIAILRTNNNGTGSQRTLHIRASNLQSWGDTQFWVTASGTTCVGVIPVSSGVVRFTDPSGSDFGRLQFGGSTSSFPALKRNGAALDIRLADDSTVAGLNCGNTVVSGYVVASSLVQAYNGTAIPAGGATNTGVMFSSTSGFGVFFGSGAPTVSAAKGSLYLRSDGSTINDRMYVNTNGSTTWTAVTTTS